MTFSGWTIVMSQFNRFVMRCRKINRIVHSTQGGPRTGRELESSEIRLAFPWTCYVKRKVNNEERHGMRFVPCCSPRPAYVDRVLVR